MSDITRARLVRRPALSGLALGSPSAAVELSALPEGHVLQALAAPGVGDLAGRLAAISDGGPFAVRPMSPGQWFVVGDAVLDPADVARRAQAVEDLAALCDQSQGRVRISLSGPAAEALLSHGTAVDVSQSAFPVGRSAQTLFGHIGIHLTRTGEQRFELMVLRSFADSLREDLEALARPHLDAA